MFRLVNALLSAFLFATWVGLAVYNIERGHSSWFQWAAAALIFVLAIYNMFTLPNDKQG